MATLNVTLNSRSTNSGHDWAAEVNRRQPVLDLEPGLFTWDQPERIAASLLQSARRSRARKRSVYGSAMAMLCLYINRAGRKLPARRRSILTQAKTCLRELAGVHQNGEEPGSPTHQCR
jgi:hypothetical protein